MATARSSSLYACVAAATFSCLAATRTAAAQAPPDPSLTAAPIAFVYVSRVKSGLTHEVIAFAAAPNGHLTPVSGSPFAANISTMVVNGKYLFGSNPNGNSISTFTIQSAGALHFVRSSNIRHGCDDSSGYGTASLVLDHTGTSLYDLFWNGETCNYNIYQSFHIDNSTGTLVYLGGDNEETFSSRVSFLANNRFAYGAVCDPFASPPGPNIYVYRLTRASNGLLAHVSVSTKLPVSPKGYGFCPYFVAADPANHLAVAGQFTQSEDLFPPIALATFTADANGNLTTGSTAANMPGTIFSDISEMKMSPSGKLLAVSGPEGLQIFHFNGGSAITHFSNDLTPRGANVGQIFWDNANHLYAVSPGAQKLFVFTATPTGISQAPGSPYSIPQATNVIVQPR